ncbi:hypothetical protein B0H14DRAFT_2602576 [Mycena olivaceomarginata]|nr:hypothetical protein B0H14DRAFT_2602576 [Mycena olivaceomarginata]
MLMTSAPLLIQTSAPIWPPLSTRASPNHLQHAISRFCSEPLDNPLPLPQDKAPQRNDNPDPGGLWRTLLYPLAILGVEDLTFQFLPLSVNWGVDLMAWQALASVWVLEHRGRLEVATWQVATLTLFVWVPGDPGDQGSNPANCGLFALALGVEVVACQASTSV